MKNHGQFSKFIVGVNRAFTHYIHSIIEEFTDAETTQQEKNELLASTASMISMVSSSILTTVTVIATILTLVTSPIQRLNAAYRRNAAQVEELRKLEKSLDNTCTTSNDVQPAPKSE